MTHFHISPRPLVLLDIQMGSVMKVESLPGVAECGSSPRRVLWSRKQTAPSAKRRRVSFCLSEHRLRRPRVRKPAPVLPLGLGEDVVKVGRPAGWSQRIKTSLTAPKEGPKFQKSQISNGIFGTESQVQVVNSPVSLSAHVSY